MTRLEKLKDFHRRDEEIKARARALEIENKMLGDEFMKYMREEFGLPADKQVHLAQILTSALESSHEPIIQAP